MPQATKEPTELTSPVPDDCPLVLKNVRVSESLSQETTAYTASLWWKGKRVADASNHGTGGSDLYHFTDRAVEQEVAEYARQHVAFPTEPIDQLVGVLLDERDLAKHTKAFVKRGCRFVAVAFKGHYDLPSHDGSERVTGYSQEFVIGTGSRAAFMAEAVKDEVQAFRVLHDTTTAEGN
jgi:hypothetical protein